MARLGRFLGAFAFAVASLATAPFAAHAGGDQKVTYTHEAMGTVISLTMWIGDEVLAAKASRAAFDEFDRIDTLMSSWNDTSDVTKINSAAGGKPVVVTDEVFEVIEASQKMSKLSGGAFDITVGSYRGLWKFDQDRDGSIPGAKDVEARRKLVGYRNIKLNRAKKTVKLAKKGQRITLGGVAKGYAIDRALALLRDAGVKNFILQAGGDLYARGNKAGAKWKVGIRDPRGGVADSFAITEIEDATFSTSGDYERYVIVEGVRYHHIIDPATGRPATGTRSVTVRAEGAMTADMWSTALFVMGAKKGIALAERTKGIDAVFVDDDNKVQASSRFRVVRAADFGGDGKKSLDGVILLLKEPTAGI